MTQQRAKRARRPRRRGLAPLELVLWLPILVCVAYLFVNFATMAVWRIRGEIVARDAGWRTFHPRGGQPRPDASIWPANAGAGAAGTQQTQQIADLDYLQYSDQFGPETVRVVRGPLDYGYAVTDLLDPLRGADSGRASITRDYPFLPNMGPYNSGQIAQPLLDDKWQASQMLYQKVRWWTWWSDSFYTRRSLALYKYPRTDPALSKAYIDAAIPVVRMCRPDNPDVRPIRVLDHDWLLLEYHKYLVEWDLLVQQVSSLLSAPNAPGNAELLGRLLPEEEQQLLAKCMRYRGVGRYDCPWCRRASARSLGPRRWLHFADFHPSIWGCAETAQQLYDEQVRGRLLPRKDNQGRIILGEICSLPRSMTSHYLYVFLMAKAVMNLQIAQLEDQLNAKPPPSPADQQRFRDQIAGLKNQVSVLESVAGIGQLKAYLELVETTLEPQLIAKLQAAMP